MTPDNINAICMAFFVIINIIGFNLIYHLRRIAKALEDKK